MINVPYAVEGRPARVVVFGPLQSILILSVLVAADREFPDALEDQIEVHANTRTRSVEVCLYQKHEPLTPIEGPTIGRRGGQFVWGLGCRVSMREIRGVVERYFRDRDEDGGVVLLVNSSGHLVMEPCDD